MYERSGRARSQRILGNDGVSRDRSGPGPSVKQGASVVNSLVNSLVNSFVNSFVNCLVDSLANPPVDSLVDSLVNLF